MNNALLFLCGLAVATLAALFAVPHFVDWSSHRSAFEEQASRVLGREVRVGGAVSLRLLPAPYVEFERIRIAEDAGAAGEPLFRAEKFTMWLSVPPLLRGVLEAKEVTLKRPVLRLVVDGEGQGSWRTLALRRADLPFMPAGVTLQSVKITKGTVLLQKQGGGDLGRIDAVNGELSAEALDGPYKFSGAVKWQGSEREVRVATAKADPDGGVRFKGSVRAEGREYVLDGRIADLNGSPKLSGDVSAKLAFSADRPALEPGSPVQAERPAFELRAKVEGDGMGVALRDLTLSFENAGQPQLITGEAMAAWGESPRLDLTLSSRWLDLDRIAGTAEGTPPLEVARVLLGALAGAMPDEARTATTFSVDQVALGGEAVSGLTVSLVRSEGPLRLERFGAGMPGGARLELEGEVSPNAEKPAFKGTIALHGTNLGRFLAWASRAEAPGGAQTGGPFAVRGQLDATLGGLELTHAIAELAGMPIEGDVRYRAEERRRLDVRIEGRTVDLALLWPGLSLEALGTWLFPGDGGTATGWARPDDVSIEVRLAELVSGERTLRDLDAAFSLEAGRLAIRGLSFRTADGLAFAADGGVDGTGTDQHGNVRWTLEAPSASSLAPVAGIAGPGTLAEELASRAATLAPLRLAGSLTLGQRGAASADIMADGMANGGRLTANVRLDGGLTGWREAPVEAAITIESPDLAWLSGDLRAASRVPAPEPSARAGTVFIAATGVPARGLAATASVNAQGLEAGFNGTVTVPATGVLGDWHGRMTIAAASAREALALAGLPSAPAAGRFPVNGSLDIARTEAGLELAPAGLAIGGAEVSGRMTLSKGSSADTKLVADLHVSEASLNALLSILLGDQATATGDQLAAKPGVWPAEAFDFSGLDRLEGEIKADFGRLEAGGGLALAPARLEARVSPGKVEVTKFDGSALGASLGSAMTLEKEAAGVRLKGAMRLDGAQLAALRRSPGDRAASGLANIELSFGSQALSPGALVAALAGSGRIELDAARIAGLTPAGVGAATDTVLLGRAPAKGEGLIKALRAGLAEGDLELGSREIPVEILDGAARVKSFTVEGEKGRTTSEITVDLATLEVDSEWRIEVLPAARNPPRPPLPPVTVGYVGPLAGLSALEPRVTADAFERELAVRRLERDVDELERLRKADEERTRADAERQKALAAEQARAATAAPEAGDPAVPPDSSWAPAAAPENDTAAPPPASADAGAPPAVPAAPARQAPANQGSLTNAAPVRPRKPPPAFNPWDQLDRSLQN